MKNWEDQRAYFAAHAPDVPDWFKWENPQAKPVLERADKVLSREAYALWEGRHFDVILDEEYRKKFMPEVRAFTEHQDATQRAIDYWSMKDHLGRIAAWRWAYADAMMAGFGK